MVLPLIAGADFLFNDGDITKKIGSSIADPVRGFFDKLDRGQNEFRDIRASDFQNPAVGQGLQNASRLQNQFGGQQAFGPVGASQFGDDQRFALNALRGELTPGGFGQTALRQQLANLQQRQDLSSQSQLASQRNPNAALSARSGLLANANAAQGLGAQGAIGSNQLALGALQGIGGLASQARRQDQALGFGNLESQIQQRQQQNRNMLEAGNLGLGFAGLGQEGTLAGQNARTARFNALLKNPTNTERAVGFFKDIASLGSLGVA